jgi:hypothetical protein
MSSILVIIGLEDGPADRHSLVESSNSSFSMQNIPLKDPSERVGESHVGGGKNDKKGAKAEQGVVKDGMKEGVSVSAAASHSSKSNLQHLSMKTEAEADAEALQEQQEQDEDEREGEEEGEEERAKETKVDYHNDTQVSTKEKEKKEKQEKEKEKEREKKSAEGNLKGSFGVLPSHPPANVEVRTG